MWFLVKIIAIKVLGGSYTKFATHNDNVQWMYYCIMRTIVLLICTTLIAQMIVGAVPPNDVTTGVLSQRQQRQDRISIRRRIVTHDRLDRQRQQRLRQQQVRDQNRERRRSSRAQLIWHGARDSRLHGLPRIQKTIQHISLTSSELACDILANSPNMYCTLVLHCCFD